MAQEISFVIRPMTLADVPQVSALHARIFPDYFLTQLGVGVLNILYTELASNPRAWSFVCAKQGQVAGFVCGVSEWDRIKKQIAMRHSFQAARALVPQMLRAPSLLVPFLERVVPAPQKFFNKQSDAAHPEYPCYLLSIGVAPEARGSDAATLLTQALFETLQAKGFASVALYTHANNQRAQAFFEKMGFRFASSEGQGDGASLIYERPLQPVASNSKT